MNIIHFETIDSTNTYLKNNYKQLDNLTIVSSDVQSSGRGRNNRKWDSSKGNNLLFSILIKDKNIIRKYKSLSIISAYTIIQILKQYGIEDVYLKWPNDVIVNNKKICGVLLEAVSKNAIECLIIGVGLNVNEDKFDKEYLIEATSMKNELNKTIDLNELKDIVYKKFIENINTDYDFYDDIKECDYLKNKKVSIQINNELKDVEVIGIDHDYSLKVKDKDKIINIEAGEASMHI